MDQEYLSKWMSLAKLISLYAWFRILKTAENGRSLLDTPPSGVLCLTNWELGLMTLLAWLYISTSNANKIQ